MPGTSSAWNRAPLMRNNKYPIRHPVADDLHKGVIPGAVATVGGFKQCR